MAITQARCVAYDTLLRVETRDAFAVEVLYAAGSDFTQLSSADRALCLQIVMGVLRWQSWLDDAISTALDKPMRRLDPEVAVALRMGAFQIGWLRVPDHAAVHESVELVKRARKRSAADMVNAVLRRLAREKQIGPPPEISPQAPQITDAAELARLTAHPEWLVRRWQQEYGDAAAAAVCIHDQQLPQTTLRVPPATDAKRLQQELSAGGVELEPGRLMANARRVVAGDVTQTAAYREGRVFIQDEASQLVAALVGRGQRVLDCCAAPGGKTAAIAEANPTAQVLAVELNPQRARSMKQRMPSQNVEVVVADVRTLPGAETFDRILADVPCSGSGTLGRNPEIKWRFVPADIADLARRQREILHSALDRLAPGGRLVYSTCSLEKEECEAVVEEELKGSGDRLRLVQCLTLLKEMHGRLSWPEPESLCAGPYLRTIPGLHPCDGFFAAVLERAA